MRGPLLTARGDPFIKISSQASCSRASGQALFIVKSEGFGEGNRRLLREREKSREDWSLRISPGAKYWLDAAENQGFAARHSKRGSILSIGPFHHRGVDFLLLQT